MSDADVPKFDPRTILTALQAAGVSSVLIGALARVARGTDEITRGVDICPAPAAANLLRLSAALEALAATSTGGEPFHLDEADLSGEPVLEVGTGAGQLKIVLTPAGVPRGYEALRAAATREHLGAGVRPEIASTGDLIAMSAALRRDRDLTHLSALRRILELEADPAAILPAPPRLPARLEPGAALRGQPGHLDRSRRSGPGSDRSPGR